MLRPSLHLVLASLALAASAPPAEAHEDDQKVLDRRGRVELGGLRTGTPAALGLAAHQLVGVGAGVGAPQLGTVGSSGGTILKSINLGRDFPQQGIRLLSWMTLFDLYDSDSGSNCWGYTSPSGREYALVGVNQGTAFVDITDPGNPQPVALIPAQNSLWHDVRTYQQYAYAVTEGGGGIQVIDLSQIDGGVVTHVGSVKTGGSNDTHTMTINEASGYLYRSGGDGNGLRIYSLANPANPMYVGAWQARYVHAATVVSYTSGPYAGKEIAFCCGGLNNGGTDTGVDILDVTNKSNIQYLSHTKYSKPGYSHQAWPSEDLKYLYVGDELDENGFTKTVTKVLDITDLANPVELPEFESSKKAISHNLYVKGDLIFEANYTAGLRVFDASDPENPVETMFFDTYPDTNQATFNGLWHVYPYFPSGVVIGSDVDRGLFCLWVGEPLVDFTYAAGLAPSVISPVGDTLEVTLAELTPGDLEPGSGELHYDAGAGWVSAPLAALGGGLHAAPLPALACGDELRYYLTARSTNGITWTDPPGAPGTHHLATAAAAEVVALQLDFVDPQGFTVGVPDDDATNGIWEHANPKSNSAAQPGDDVSPNSGHCWTTGNPLIGSSVLEKNVGGGKTTLVSGVYDLTGYAEPLIGYWRWYSNHVSQLSQVPFEDIFTVEITSDGSSWVTVETVGPTGVEAQGGWYHHQFRVSDFVTPSSAVQMRFVASDYGSPSLVEAAIDEFELLDASCSAGPVSYCTAGTSASGCQATLSASGTASATAGSGFTLSASSVEGQKDGLFFFGSNGRQANPWGSGTSFQCVVPPVFRGGLLAGSGAVGACDGTLAQDLNALWCPSCPRPAKNPGAGATVQAQLWYRDPLSTSNQTTSLSDAIEFTVAP